MCSTTVEGDSLRPRAAARKPRSLRTARNVLACTRLSMNELLARIVDGAKRDLAGERIQDAARGRELDLAPDLRDARSNVGCENRRGRRIRKPRIDAPWAVL